MHLIERAYLLPMLESAGLFNFLGAGLLLQLLAETSENVLCCPHA